MLLRDFDPGGQRSIWRLLPDRRVRPGPALQPLGDSSGARVGSSRPRLLGLECREVASGRDAFRECSLGMGFHAQGGSARE